MESDVNKMNLSNLGMIFCSTLRIDRFCFNWLVNSWADCWAGCLTEEAEYERFMPKRFPSNASSLKQQHPPQAPSHQQPPQTPSYQQPPPYEHTPPAPSSRQPQAPHSDSRTSSQIRQSAETGRSVDTGRSVEADASQDVWPTVPNREKLTIPPLSATLARKEGKDGRHALSLIELDYEQAAHRERMEREREKELEREREREEALGARPQYNHHDHHPHHKLAPSTDRTLSVVTDGEGYSTVVEPNKSPRQSIAGDCGRFGLLQSLPPIPPLSPMIREGRNS